MDYRLSCPCGREHIVSPSQAGQEIICECGQELRVPTLRGMSALPPAATAPPTPATVERRRGSWQGWRGPAIALASTGLLIALLFCGWFALQRWSIPTDYTIENEITAGEELLEQYDPRELSLVWDSFEKLGLRTKDPPEFYLWNRYAEERATLAGISGGIAAFFALVAAGIWISARKAKPDQSHTHTQGAQK